MKNKRLSMYGVSRIDDEAHRTHAWRVSLHRRGSQYVKNFPDKKHGGKFKALQLAKKYRNKVIRKHPPLTRKEFSSLPRANNKSGITGVYRYAKPYTLKDGTVCEKWYWEAHWPLERGESRSVSFAVDDFGEEMARRMAIRAREQGVKRVKGVYWASERGEVLIRQAARNRSPRRSAG